MKQLSYGSRGPEVEFLQLALNRAGCGPIATDGIFGGATMSAAQQAQRQFSLSPDGIAGVRTQAALQPYYTGYLTHIIVRGDTLYRIAAQYHTSLRAVEIANPYVNALDLRVGALVTVPLDFPVVPTGIHWTSEVLDCVTDGLSARYPFLRRRIAGRSAMGKPIYAMTMGAGARNLLYCAAHHANEWITTPLVLQFVEELAEAYAREQGLCGYPAGDLLSKCHLMLVPCVNPDGMDLVTGFLRSGPMWERTRQIAANYPDIPYPEGWKANIRGVDLNLQYPASWEEARQQKFAHGYISPAPRDYVGKAPLTEPEARTMVRLTQLMSPDRILTYHTQGQVIYPNYLNFNPPGSAALGETLGKVSSYAVEDTPKGSAYAGYKDWFIQHYNRPGYTVEAGLGKNPLPISDFEDIYAHNLPIFVETMQFEP